MTDRQDTNGAVSNATLGDALDRYFDFKARVADETGLLIGTEYTMLAQGGGPAVGEAATARGFVAAGLRLAVRGDDLFGVSLAWTRSANGARDQYTAELFDRLHILRNLAPAPDLQIVLNPEGRAAGSAVAIAGLRLRVHL